jgi:quercetin dioxygenase-like cupin family protein
MEYEAKPGNEPPPHLHEFENETLYVLEARQRLTRATLL